MPIGHSLARLCVGLCVLLGVGACELPRSGPSYSEITNGEAPTGYGFHVLPLTPEVAAINTIDERSGFSVTFFRAAVEPVALVARGDVLAITVWENADEGLLNPTGIGATPLPHVKVDERGRIFVPYVGLVQASGRTLNQIREEIRSRMSGKTVDPQIDVFPVTATGRRGRCGGHEPSDYVSNYLRSERSFFGSAHPA